MSHSGGGGGSYTLSSTAWVRQSKLTPLFSFESLNGLEGVAVLDMIDHLLYIFP
jgi:hypothetical protein